MINGEWEVPIIIAWDFTIWDLGNFIEQLDCIDCYIDLQEIDFDRHGNALLTVYGSGLFAKFERVVDAEKGVSIDHEALSELLAESGADL